ncbi:MAG TPA: hypothetical protein VL984_13825 [Acidimicrobiales bacterium]|nr:hypothetical protein [Acidimicrobiales bacterium]
MAHISASFAGDNAGPARGRTWAGSAGSALLATGCLAALFLPFARTGGATRSGYTFVRAAQAAGLLQGPWAHVLDWSLLAVPVLAGLSGAAAVMQAWKASVLFGALAGLVTLAYSAWSLFRSRTGAPFGPWVGAVLGAMAVATILRYVAKGSAFRAG